MKDKDNDNERKKKIEEYLDTAYFYCEDKNYETMTSEYRAFKNSDVAKFFDENAAYITGIIISRTKDIKAGKNVYAFRPYDIGALENLLTSVTTYTYEHVDPPRKIADEEVDSVIRNKEYCFNPSIETEETEYTDLQRELLAALLQYATTAASYAKSVDSKSLLDWVTAIDIIEQVKIGYRVNFLKEEAENLITHLNSAADRLRLEGIISKLPRFKKAVPKPKTKTNLKTKKKR